MIYDIIVYSLFIMVIFSLNISISIVDKSSIKNMVIHSVRATATINIKNIILKKNPYMEVT